MSGSCFIQWAPRARLRLLEILRDIHDSTGPAVAARWAEHLLRAPEALARHPRLGRMVPEIGRPDIRELIVPPYRIFYRVRPGSCQVLSIRHARQHTTPGNFDA